MRSKYPNQMVEHVLAKIKLNKRVSIDAIPPSIPTLGITDNRLRIREDPKAYDSLIGGRISLDYTKILSRPCLLSL
jgi:hypothetical protein